MKIAIAGMGYVGLANAVLLAQNNEVVAYDILEKTVDLVNLKKSPITDKELEEYLHTKELNLTATNDDIKAYTGADYIIIATPTNYDTEKEFFDTSSVETVISKINEISPSSTIVVKSTVPVGFTKKIQNTFPKLKILFSPEFLREGKALYDNLHPSRIVVGTSIDNHDLMKIADNFAQLLKNSAIEKDIPILITNSTEAEAIKLFANTFLAMRVAYFNELDTYAEIKGLDTGHIIEGVSLDPRIGTHYNNPSFGYGGYCLPKDTKQLLANYKDVPSEIIGAVVKANMVRKEFIANRILEKNPKVVGIYRINMKSNSDNFRQSSVRDIMEILESYNIEVVIYEPAITEAVFEGKKVINSLKEFKKLADVIVANRYNEVLDDVSDKTYTRDVYFRD